MTYLAVQATNISINRLTRPLDLGLFFGTKCTKSFTLNNLLRSDRRSSI